MFQPVSTPPTKLRLTHCLTTAAEWPVAKAPETGEPFVSRRDVGQLGMAATRCIADGYVPRWGHTGGHLSGVKKALAPE